MKRVIVGLCAALLVMSCVNKNENQGYIGVQDVTIENGVLSPDVLLALGRVSDAQMSPDGQKILYGVTYTSVEKNATSRNLFVCNADGSDKVQLTRYAKSVSCARWSSDGSCIYFLQGGQLYKAAYKGSKLGKKVKLSDVPEGISEFKLSPDESQILYISSIKNPFVDQPKDLNPALDKAQAYATNELMYRHWDHWVTQIPRSFIAPFGSETITPENSVDILGDEPFELPTEPFGGCEQLSWSPDGRYIAYSCRKLYGKQYAFSTCTDIFVYDVQTAQTKAVTCGGGYDTNPTFSPDGKSLAWISMERNGYEADRQRLMVGSFEEGSVEGIKELTTEFIYDVQDIFWTPDSKRIIFPAFMDALGALCSADVENGGIERLTPEQWWYTFGTPYGFLENEYQTVLYTSIQSMSFPTELAKITFQGGSASFDFITSENEHILSQVNKLKEEQIVLKTAQGENLYCWVIYPDGFDPSKKYAGVEMFNGGPQTCLEQGWSFRWNFYMMAQQGYVVILPNRHGDSGFGQAWKEQISGDYQGLNMEDYKIAARWFRSQPWAGKIAGVGASYGGFSVYNMMGMNDGLFDCFISHAGIFDEKMMWYTTEESWFCNWDNGGLMEYAYQEGQVGPKGDGVTFGGLQQAGAPYANVAKTRHSYDNDPESKVTKWNTPILCMHGMMDFRIPYTQGMAAFNAAQMMGVPSRLVIFPEETHFINQPQNALLWHTEFFGWLEQWIKE